MPDPNYRKMSAKELEGLLRERNLPVGGTKVAMISRLLAADRTQLQTDNEHSGQTSYINLKSYMMEDEGVHGTMNMLERIAYGDYPVGLDLPALPLHVHPQLLDLRNLEGLGLRLSDIKINVSKMSGENMLGFPSPFQVPDFDSWRWGAKLVTFELPLSNQIRLALGTGPPGEKMIASALWGIWRQTDSIAAEANYVYSVHTPADSVFITLKAWGREGMARRGISIQNSGNHCIIWGSTLTLQLYARFDVRRDLWPGDEIPRWVGVNILYTYPAPADLVSKLSTAKSDFWTASVYLSKRVADEYRSCGSWHSYVDSMPGPPSLRKEVDDAGALIPWVFFEHDRQYGSVVRIQYLFRIPSYLGGAFFDREGGRLAELKPFFGTWADTIQMEHFNKPLDTDRYFTVKTPHPEFTLTDPIWKDLKEKTILSRESIHSNPMLFQLEATLTRQESAHFSVDRDASLKFASLLLARWRFKSSLAASEKLYGYLEIHPSCVRFLLCDCRTKEEQDDLCSMKIKMPPMEEYSNSPASFDGDELFPGLPDFLFPLGFFIEHEKRKHEKREQEDEIGDEVSTTPPHLPPEDTFLACVDLIQELYAMAEQYLDTLQAMEREFPHKMEEFRRKREGANEVSGELDSFDPKDYYTTLTNMWDFEAHMEEIGCEYLKDLGWSS